MPTVAEGTLEAGQVGILDAQDVQHATLDARDGELRYLSLRPSICASCAGWGGEVAVSRRIADDLLAREIQRRAEQRETSAWDISDYYVEAKPPDALHLGFAAVPEAEILPAVQRLREAIADLL